ncbi:MAG: lysophospholipid acyltransferase family protein [Bacteroidota bacterium]|nr:lysophospholipid acyltransferase family protein [Bacteroidota bacterium]
MSSLKAFRRSIRYGVIYRALRSMIWMSALLPRKMWLNICGGLGSLAWYFARETRALTLRHLRMAYPEKTDTEIKRMGKRNFKMLGMNAGDILRSSRIEDLAQLETFLFTHGLENYTRAHARGKGVIFLTCHLGAFDLQITNMAMRGLNPNIIGTPLKDKRLNDLLWNYRNLHGAIPIARGKETFRMIKVLKSGGSVALLIDQDTRVKTVFVDFFGMQAATPVGATILALKTGAAIVPTYIYLGEDYLQHMHLLPEIPMTVTGDEEEDVRQNTQVLTNFIERVIRQHPDQWVWMHERWKTKPEQPTS